jgi:hypothetical protein
MLLWIAGKSEVRQSSHRLHLLWQSISPFEESGNIRKDSIVVTCRQAYCTANLYSLHQLLNPKQRDGRLHKTVRAAWS